eukprot:1140634-Pelagomonas_calceolata.AAC.3
MDASIPDSRRELCDRQLACQIVVFKPTGGVMPQKIAQFVKLQRQSKRVCRALARCGNAVPCNGQETCMEPPGLPWSFKLILSSTLTNYPAPEALL